MMHCQSSVKTDGVRTIAIVGAGFSGSTLAANLLLQPPGARTHIILIDRAPDFCRGVAYAKRDFPYLLNVPAGQMSADPKRPREFLDFARTRLPNVSEEDFLPRSLYGDYLEERLRNAERKKSAHIQFTKVCASVHDMAPEGACKWRLHLSEGASIVADDVVLACGNPPARPLELGKDVEPLVVDPWHQKLNLDDCHTVLLVGTGLTMVDVALRLASQARVPVIHAISRHGLLPLVQTAFSRCPQKLEGKSLFESKVRSTRSILRELRIAIGEHSLSGGDWREIVTALRRELPDVWQSLSDAERRRFLRHLRPYWDVHRHRLPPSVMEKITRLKEQGTLHVHAGRLQHAEYHRGMARVYWSCRRSGRTRQLEVNRIVNCTGPEFDLGRSADSLWRSLRDQGIVAADALRLGLKTNHSHQVIGRDAVPVHGLWYLGPMLRATYWEATAVPELRVHAAALSERLSAKPVTFANRFVTQSRLL